MFPKLNATASSFVHLKPSMSPTNPSSAPAHYGSFERARSAIGTLSAEIRNRPFSHFLRPSDRCVPRSLLTLSLDEIADLSLEDLLRLPGVGPKKIANLAAILERTIAEPFMT